MTDLRIARPAGVPVRLEIAKGATEIRLDGRRFGAVGGGLADQTADVVEGAPHYAVTVAGSAARLTIVEAD